MGWRGPDGRRRRGCLALALSSALALLVAELACRGLFGAPLAERTPLMEVRANAGRAWEMIPSSEHYSYLHRVRVNALGLRGPELGEPRAGERRVLFLGDSLVYGQGVADEDTLPARLERALAREGRSWQVINGGLRAYNTRQELALLEELLPRVRPDVVVLAWFANDVEEFDVARMAQNLERSGPVVFDVHARWEGAVVWRWHVRQLVRASALAMTLHHQWSDRHIPQPSPLELERAWVLQEGYLARFVELARAHGFRFVLASIPINRELVGPHASAERTRRLRELALARGLELVDLLPALRDWTRAHGRLPILAYDGHYDATGNEVMAGALAPHVLGTPTPR